MFTVQFLDELIRRMPTPYLLGQILVQLSK